MCDGCDEKKHESKGLNTVNLVCRIATMALAVASALLMATASQSQCTAGSPCATASQSPCTAGSPCATAGQYTTAGQCNTAGECNNYGQYVAPARTVTYTDFGPFVYLVVANAVAACLEAIATLLHIKKKDADKISEVLLHILDAAVQPLLYSSTGAAFAAAGDMTYCSANGRRVSVCDVGTGNFCSQVHMSTYSALAAAAAVSIAEVAKNVSLSLSRREPCSDTDSECGFEHGCHKH